MEPQVQAQQITFLRRVDVADYLEDQSVSITIGGDGGTDTDTIENLLKGADLIAYECELEGRRVVLLGFESKS